MTKTLADMTPEELAQCEGMWCEDEDGNLCIYKADHRVPKWLAICIYPDRVGTIASVHSRITLRPDLPRAWRADGTPPPGHWEDDYTDAEGSTLTTGEDLGIGPHQEIRRFVGEWEQA